MSVLATESPFSVRQIPDLGAAEPVIRREGVGWRDGVDSPLTLELLFENPSRRPTRAREATVEVAGFGAFLPWRPLARVLVPALPPGGRRRVITALADGTPLPPRPVTRFLAALLSDQRATLSARSAHFVGNLNVFVRQSRPVERHMQRAIGLAPGVLNHAVFMVGDGRPDTYTFSRGPTESGWELELINERWDEPVELAHAVVGLAIRPPEHSTCGSASVFVERASTAQRVPVEFELESRVGASRCYFL